VITLPEDLQWVDEFAPWKVAQVFEHSLSGALIVQESAKLAGRPITLQSGGDFGMASRAVVEALQTLEAVANGPTMTLTVPAYEAADRTFAVRFRRDTPAIEAAPLKVILPQAPTDWYSLTLRLLQVS
jgi:hypothetical protein